MHAGIALARRSQARQVMERFQRHFVQPDFRVEAERWLQILRFQRAARQFIQPLPQRANFVRPDAQTRGHCVSAVAQQQIAAFAQRGGQIETGDAAA